MKNLVGSLIVGFFCLQPALAQEEGGATTPAASPAFDDALQDSENWREVDPENLIKFRILDGRGQERGTIFVEIATFTAPGHIERFKELIRSGDLNGTVFHRVIDDFMAQGGDVEAKDPSLTGKWADIPGEFTFIRYPLKTDGSELPMHKLGPDSSATNGYIMGFPVQTQSEYLASLTKEQSVESWIPHCEGVVSTARTDDPNSASTQFFLMREARQHLDREYTSWGRVLVGQDVVDSIKVGEPVSIPDMLISADIVADLPEDEQPRVLVQRTDGPDYAPILEANAGVNVCDLPAVPALVSE
ncbi:MAG: peptidylprolyl isomerase [Ponticaulis sp.]|nr:peptidylprolyl isomerase [Ponticaulis sp.]|tara:strand:+ start:24757 stop:25662 length:906 start_codon:yes stop_codon:yes gene_type:complete